MRAIKWSEYASNIANNPSIPKQMKVTIVLGGIWLISRVIDKVGKAAGSGLVLYLIYQLFGTQGREVGESVQRTIDRLGGVVHEESLKLAEGNDDVEGSTYEIASDEVREALGSVLRQLEQLDESGDGDMLPLPPGAWQPDLS